jgi:hypothetical protein
MKKTPCIDGTIGSKEWKSAGASFGSTKHRSSILSQRNAVFFLGYDKKNIYFACRSELPPKGMELLTRARTRDSRVYSDDAVELLLIPPDKKYVYQIISNSIGTLFDVKYPVVRGGVDHTNSKPWNPNAKVASSFHNGVWDIEMSIPFKELGQASPIFGQDWKIQMVRDWQRPAEPATWNKATVFCEPADMGTLAMDTSAPAVQFSGLGRNYRKGKYNINFEVYNPSSSPVEIKCLAQVISNTAPRGIDKKYIVSAGQKKSISLAFDDRTECERTLNVHITSNGKTIYQRKFSWIPATKNLWTFPGARANVNFDFAYYPYLKTVKARVNMVDAKKAGIKDVIMYVKKAEKVIGKIQYAKLRVNSYDSLWKLPLLAEGKYLICADILYKNGSKKHFSKSFIVKHFPWENNQIGMEKVIVPPFKPLMTKTNLREIKALLTGYRIKGIFWDKVYAQGENILAAPVVLKVNNVQLNPKEKTFKFTEISQTDVKSEAVYDTSPLEFKVKHHYEYDGMCKVSLQVTPHKPVKITSASLEIPLKKHIASLFHTVHNTMKWHPADKIPEGTGTVWNSLMGKQSSEVAGNFRPYVWLGGIYKGFCWFTASDKNWSLDYSKAAIEIVRRNSAVILKINLVNKECIWEKPFNIVMGFQPTPVKPKPRGWRKLSSRWKPAGSIGIASLCGNAIWGGKWAADPWPIGRDYSMVRMLSRKNRKTAWQNTDDMNAFIKKHFASATKEKKDFMRRHLIRGRNWAKFCTFLVPYLNPRGANLKWEEYQTFMDEWWYSNYRANNYDEYNIEPLKSYQDMFLYYCRQLIRNGLDGLYFDNVRERTSFDPVTGPAYELPDGNIQPYFDIFSMRELIKRAATMLYVEKKTFLDKRPLLIAHMTNTNLIPYMSFATMTLDLEAKFGGSDFQERFSEDWLLSETIGTQTGCVPQILVKITGNERDFVTRTFLAVTLAYDLPIVMNAGGLTGTFYSTWAKLRNFGYGSDKVEVFACWNKNNPLKTLTPGVRSTLYLDKANRKAIVIISDFGSGGKAVLDIGGIGFTPEKTLNFETGKPVMLQGTKLETTLKKHDFKIFLLKGKK